jgi:hypothetical protein
MGNEKCLSRMVVVGYLRRRVWCDEVLMGMDGRVAGAITQVVEVHWIIWMSMSLCGWEIC